MERNYNVQQIKKNSIVVLPNNKPWNNETDSSHYTRVKAICDLRYTEKTDEVIFIHSQNQKSGEKLKKIKA